MFGTKDEIDWSACQAGVMDIMATALKAGGGIGDFF
jgi:hypothetical protein